MTPLEFSIVFGAGLVSGLHCLGMCGPIVVTYSVVGQASWKQHLLYNGGRISTYMFLGALAGAAGAGIGVVGKMAGMASGARIVSGAAMIVAAILMVGFVPASGLVAIQKPSRFTRKVARLLMAPGGKFRLGLVLGFLPCGLVYAALLKAMESAGALAGALTMMAYGLGTAVALLAVGMASSLAGARTPARWSNRVAAASIAIAGAVLLWKGLAPGPHCHG
jgi:sulfite exporter TauE/SafE